MFLNGPLIFVLNPISSTRIKLEARDGKQSKISFDSYA
jgi:hypothetical protein